MAIVTLQAGNFANFCGSHFWNFEDEVYGVYQDECPIDPEICYHELPSGKWSPRLTIVDKTGASGRIGCEEDEEVPDDPLLVVCRQDPIAVHPFQEAVATQEAIEPAEEFRQNIRYWSDFLKVDVKHNVHELVGVHHRLPFTYFIGRSETHQDEREAIENRLRRQIEQSDRLEALHALVDSTDGFASIADDLLQWMREENPKCGILVAPLSQLQEDCVEPRANACAVNDAINRRVAQGFFLHAAFNAKSNMVVPMDVQCWSEDPSAHWSSSPCTSYSSSAIIGAAVHNLSFPYRTRARTNDTNGAGSFMRAFRAKSALCGLRLSMPCVRPFDTSEYVDLTSTPFDAECAQIWTVRGSAACSKVAEQAAREHASGARSLRWTVMDGQMLPVPIPFPQEFHPSIQHDGSLGTEARIGDVETCSIGTVLHEATEPSQSLVQIIQSMDIFRRRGRVQAAASYGLEDTDFCEVLENLRSIYE